MENGMKGKAETITFLFGKVIMHPSPRQVQSKAIKWTIKSFFLLFPLFTFPNEEIRLNLFLLDIFG